jgi:hypothetical protein
MSESIEAPSVSPLTTRLGGEPQQKRKYTRKPKESVTTPLSYGGVPIPLTTDVEVSSGDEDKPVEVVGGAMPKKRQYKKKCVMPQTTNGENGVPPLEEILYVPEPPQLVRQTNEPEEVSNSDDDKTTMGENGVSPLKEKKPRTEKQQEAFRKMREARLKKTEELKKLKELEKEQKLLEREQTKLNTITEKVVEKATELKQRKTRKPRSESPEIESREPQYVPQINSSVVCGGTHIQEKTNKPYIFV